VLEHHELRAAPSAATNTLATDPSTFYSSGSFPRLSKVRFPIFGTSPVPDIPPSPQERGEAEHARIDHLSAEELCETPNEEQQVHNSEEHGKADFAARPPLTVSPNGPCRMYNRWIISFLLEGLVSITVPMEIDEKFRLFPMSRALDCTQLPFPQGRLGRKPAKDDGHLQNHENAEETKDDHEQCKDQRGGLPCEKKSDRRDEN